MLPCAAHDGGARLDAASRRRFHRRDRLLRDIAEGGWDTPKIRAFLFEHCRRPLDLVKKRGSVPGPIEPGDETRRVPMVAAADDIMIVAAGGAGGRFPPPFPAGAARRRAARSHDAFRLGGHPYRLLEHVAALLAERHGVREFVRMRKGSATRPAEPEHVARLRQEVDAVICTDTFLVTGRAMAKERGLADYPIAVVQHPIITLTEDELHTQAEKALAEIVSVLTGR